MDAVEAITATLKGKSIRSKDGGAQGHILARRRRTHLDRDRFDGYTTVPRTMPLLMRALDELSKGKSLGATYFALWCATWDNGFVRLGRSPDLAYASGFIGSRGARGWQERVKLLEAFGFVEIRPTGDQKLGFAFLPIPMSCFCDYGLANVSTRADRSSLQDSPVCRTRPSARSWSGRSTLGQIVLDVHKALMAAEKGEEAKEASPSKAKRAAAGKTSRARRKKNEES
jgi:hypothetical protein